MERVQTECMVENGCSPSDLARKLGRHRKSISRELRRNRSALGYAAGAAQARYIQRREACRRHARLEHWPLREFVSERIAEHGWTPELVAGRLKRLFADDPRMQVSHETIYRAIYTTGHFPDHLPKHLPQARPKRRRRGQGKKRRCPGIANRTPIHERPKAVDARIETGHWEGDLIVGKGQDGFILTLVERTSRLLHAIKVQTRNAATVCRAVIEALLDRPTSWVRTITFDNGSEFAGHADITHELGTPVYFADPYAAYQRCSNDQVNGLLRRYFPKGTSFRQLQHEDLQAFVDRINNRPRKCLDYRTPNEVFQEQRESRNRALAT
jgi:IS30 family transposase